MDTNTRIDALIKEFDGIIEKETLRESIEELVKLHKIDFGQESDYKMVTTVLEELKQSLRVFSRYADRRKVCVFGSARTKPFDKNYLMAEELSKKLSQEGYMIITGAGGGIMEAGNKGAEVNMSFGVNIELPFEQSANEFIDGDPKLINYHYFFTRKLAFLKESDATVLFPGGFGTHDEGFETLTLIQTGRCAPRPIILIAKPGSTYWLKWAEFVESELLADALISPHDLSLYDIVDSVDEAMEKITSFYRVYHSIRYIGNTAIMRLNQRLSSEMLDLVNTHFKSILRSGSFALKSADEVPEDAEYYSDKPRLVFDFNRYDYGCLAKLIKTINVG